jgi:NAD(P)H-hydrate repair Nnr-like enzyme with NAD(P)H-hydrate dehydratase domain
MAALKTGADLVYIACTEDAAGPIKSYSPEFIVHPILKSSRSAGPVADAVNASFEALKPLIERADSAIVGPGLGKDKVTFQILERAVEELKRKGKPTVFDADAIDLIANKPTLLVQHPGAILTPNAHEFERLWQPLHFHHPRGWEAQAVEPIPKDTTQAAGKLMQLIHEVAATHLADSAPDQLARLQSLGLEATYVALLRKGEADLISAVHFGGHGRAHGSNSSAAGVGAGGAIVVRGSSGEDGGGAGAPGALLYTSVSGIGSPRRCGGQGDVLSGILGTFLAWQKARDNAAVAAVKAKRTPGPAQLIFGDPYDAKAAPSPTLVQASATSKHGAPERAGAGGSGAAESTDSKHGSDGPDYALIPLHATTLQAGDSKGAAASGAEDSGSIVALESAADAPARLQSLVACGHAAARLVRLAAAAAFAEHKRATTTPDIIAKLGSVFEEAFPGTE